MTQTIDLTAIVATAGDLPQGGMFALLRKIAYKAKKAEVQLNAPQSFYPHSSRSDRMEHLLRVHSALLYALHD